MLDKFQRSIHWLNGVQWTNGILPVGAVTAIRRALRAWGCRASIVRQPAIGAEKGILGDVVKLPEVVVVVAQVVRLAANVGDF